MARLHSSPASWAVVAAAMLSSASGSGLELDTAQPWLPVSSHCPVTPGLTSSQPSSTLVECLSLSAEADLLAFLTKDHFDFDCAGACAGEAGLERDRPREEGLGDEGLDLDGGRLLSVLSLAGCLSLEEWQWWWAWQGQ